MKPINTLLYKEFLKKTSRRKLPTEKRELLAIIASISPFSYKLSLKREFQDVISDYDVFNKESIQKEINKLLHLEDNEFQRKLCHIKYRELLKIMARDVIFNQDVAKTLEELSALAELIIRGVYDFTSTKFLKDGMTPLSIIAMGKLGSYELNFSSDVDIIYLYEDDMSDYMEVYNKWAISINKILSNFTQYGFLYRVDNDIRPGGKYSPLTMSASAMINFYAMYGETWQRLALLRARAICGDNQFVDNLLNDLEPYIYRKYIDFTMVSELRELKARINKESLSKEKEGKNIKLGRGGIREAEFFVQTLQIMYGGKNKRVRRLKLVEGIEALVNEGYLKEEDGQKLTEAYKFLRKVENAIQMEEEQQVYVLPDSMEKLESLARRIGIYHIDMFHNVLNKHRSFVHSLFDGLFGDEGDLEKKDINDKKGLEDCIFSVLVDEVKIKKESISFFAQLIEKIPQKYRNAYSIFLKEALVKISNFADAKRILNIFEEFLRVLVRRPIYLPLLAENAFVIEQIIQIFQASPYLGRILISSPETLDFILIQDELDRTKWHEFYKTISSIVNSVDDFEFQMKLVRQFKNSEWLKIGMKYYTGMISFSEMEFFLSNLAEASLLSVLELCQNVLDKRFPRPQQDFAIIGLGKLGSQEMNFFSDLDLIFIYQSNEENTAYYNTKLLQKVISSLTTMTEEGILYEVDMRLRPTGSQGPLVTTFENFKNYHRTSSWLFEKQALTKARVLGEKTPFSLEVSKFVGDILYGTSFEEALLKKEMVAMRNKMESELAIQEKKRDILEIKIGEGGLVDIEFVIQYIKLRYGCFYEELREVNPSTFFKKIKNLSIIDESIINVLEEKYEFLKKIESSLRLIFGYSKNDIRKDDENILLLANLMGYRDKSRFLNDIKKTKKTVRKIFKKIFYG